ncbi:MAG TPA: AAA family ATPase [Candidatus Bathyarchaeota archaeon]|nr:AAA family ATPase [Candidatus Bathyarchaeota archaeon]HEX69323.1 AAA family ATPase [Candidatus Bathyarchaeota archaeon]
MKKIIICISGLPGCGKSTVAKKLAQKYKLRYVSGGDALKELAVEAGYKPSGEDWWETEEGRRFLNMRMEDPNFDRKVDEKLIEAAKEGNIVLDSWTMPWLLDEGFKIWLDASLEIRASRTAKRDKISLEKAKKLIMEREKKTREIYRRLYGFNLGEDFSPFHIILDTNKLNADEVFKTLCMIVDRMIQKHDT